MVIRHAVVSLLMTEIVNATSAVYIIWSDVNHTYYTDAHIILVLYSSSIMYINICHDDGYMRQADKSCSLF